jgi:WD40 repeat protein
MSRLVLRAPIAGAAGDNGYVAWSADGKRLALLQTRVFGWSVTVQLMRLDDNAWIVDQTFQIRLPSPHFTCLAISPSGQFCVIGTDVYFMVLTGNACFKMQYADHDVSWAAYNVSWSPDDTRFAVRSVNNKLHLWKLSKQLDPRQQINWRAYQVMYAGETDYSCRVTNDMYDLQLTLDLGRPFRNAARNAVWSADGSCIAAVEDHRTCHIWFTATGAKFKQVSLPFDEVYICRSGLLQGQYYAHKDVRTELSLSNTGNIVEHVRPRWRNAINVWTVLSTPLGNRTMFAFGSGGKHLCIWSTNTCRTVRRSAFDCVASFDLERAVPSPDGMHLAISANNELFIYTLCAYSDRTHRKFSATLRALVLALMCVFHRRCSSRKSKRICRGVAP